MGVNGGVRIIMQHILIEPLLVPSNDPMNRTSKTPPLRGLTQETWVPGVQIPVLPLASCMLTERDLTPWASASPSAQWS